MHFNPRSPRGERLRSGLETARLIAFQSTLPAWGATARIWAQEHGRIFQSTLPAWGATPLQRVDAVMGNFNPRSPRGERPRLDLNTQTVKDFNPRSPRGERRMDFVQLIRKTQFQSTLPAWGATKLTLKGLDLLAISIHAPRVGSDFVVKYREDR